MKVRYIDFYPDEYVAGVSGRLTAVDQGVYWMVCALVYSRGGPIDDDHIWLSRLFADTHWRTIRSSLDRLIGSGKIERIEGAQGTQIVVTRCVRELQKAFTRSSKASENGGKGGRPSKENNDLAKPEAFPEKKLTTNHQPINLSTKEESTPSGDAGVQQDVDRPSLEKQAYDLGKRVLGRSSGGLITKLQKHHRGDWTAVMATLRFAADKSSPAEWVGAVLSGKRDTAWEQREAEIYAGVH